MMNFDLGVESLSIIERRIWERVTNWKALHLRLCIGFLL